MIKLSRGKLKGYFGLPYSGAVHGVDDAPSNQVRVPLVAGVDADKHRGYGYEEFAIVPGANSVEPKPGTSMCGCGQEIINVRDCPVFISSSFPFFVVGA